MRLLGTRANQKFLRAKLGLVTHENGPMGFLVQGQNCNCHRGYENHKMSRDEP